IAFLTLGLLVLGVPGWSSALGIGGAGAVAVYLAMLGYSAANHALLRNPRLGRPVTFATLCADLGVLVWIAALTGGLRSPFFAAQLLFTTLFVVLFPTPLALLPPLLTFPAVFKLERLLGGDGARPADPQRARPSRNSEHEEPEREEGDARIEQGAGPGEEPLLGEPDAGRVGACDGRIANCLRIQRSRPWSGHVLTITRRFAARANSRDRTALLRVLARGALPHDALLRILGTSFPEAD
ncbi:MAG: hypothetical protein ACJ78X_12445, partial [Myxococcales bacterium]